MQTKNEKVQYGYVVSLGNNGAAIQNALKKRNVWQSFSSDKEFLSASFLWKQLNYSAKIYEDFQEVLKLYPSRNVLLNHFQSNHVITTKSGLLKTLKYYYNHELALIEKPCHVHDIIPTSFVVHAHRDDIQYKDFVEKFNQIEKKNYYKEKVPEKHCEKNVWFIKPQSDSQGKGIILSNNFKQIESFLVSKPINSGWIIQKAIQKPLLYHDRKFDIRVWTLVTPQFQIYYYNIPYMRTSSSIYTTQSMNSQIHLTNNCQQKHFTQYSKFQDGNTIPMKQTLISYISSLPQSNGNGVQIVNNLISRMKQIIIDTMMSARKYFGKGNKKKEFELFGYDFLVDEDYRLWLLEINNNPYLGIPNNFIKQLLPLMIDQMLEIVVDPLFPPQNYTPVQEKRFQLIYKQSSTFFRISPVRIMSSVSNDKNNTTKKDKSFSKPKILHTTEKFNVKLDLYGMSNSAGKQQKTSKPIYSTPAQSIKYLLDTYCFSDIEPFMTPVSLLLTSASLCDDSLTQLNIKKIKLISQTRISKILLQSKIYDICCNILGQQKYNQKIKAQIVIGFTNSCKTFKAKMFIIKNLLPLLSQNLRSYKQSIQQAFLEAIIKLVIASAGYFDRSIFIPGQSRQNQFIRELFIKSNAMKLLLYLKKKYSKVCSNEINILIDNLSEKDWQLFYEISGNKAKRCYSPKVNTAPQNQEESIIINTNAINQEKPRILTLRQNVQIKNFRTRRHSGNKKE